MADFQHRMDSKTSTARLAEVHHRAVVKEKKVVKETVVNTV